VFGVLRSLAVTLYSVTITVVVAVTIYFVTITVVVGFLPL
jgi:hypothetical protein